MASIQNASFTLLLDTGCGKTFIATQLIANYGQKTLIVVPKELHIKRLEEIISMPNVIVGSLIGSTLVDGDVILTTIKTVCNADQSSNF